jgi:hypothetical protein
MLIQNLPTEALRNRAEELRRKSGRDSIWLDSAFNWEGTEEGDRFWRYCEYRQFENASRLQPKYFAQP